MVRRKDVDWNAIKTEYITTDTSHRRLSEKYGVSATAISLRSSAEGWVGLKEQFLSDTLAKTLDAESDKEAKRLSRILVVSDKILSAIEKAVDSFLAEELTLDKGALKQLTGALKDIKDIQTTDERDSEGGGITVVFGDDVEDYSK